MTKTCKIVIYAFLILTGVFVSNPLTAQRNFKKIKPYSFMLGVHWNIMDDDGNRFGNLFDAKNVWNMLPYPSSLNADLYFMKGFSGEVLFSFNRYDTTKIINSERGLSGMAFTGDLNFKYSIGFLMEQQIFDPFVFVGFGYTNRQALSDYSNQFGLNVGIGFNVMVYKGLGVQWRSTAKIGMMPEFNTVEGDYLQHHFGLIYKFPDMSGRSNPFGKPKYKWIHQGRKGGKRRM
jgi:OmpA-OmpF porin, OOP family